MSKKIKEFMDMNPMTVLVRASAKFVHDSLMYFVTRSDNSNVRIVLNERLHAPVSAELMQFIQ